MKLLLKIRFIGTAYCGFQVQKNGVSVQSVLCNAAQALYCTPCDITGCSRTDSGVHANAFYATLRPHDETNIPAIPVERVARAMNVFLPKDIAVMDSMAVGDDFHPRYDAEYKEYLYKIWNRSERDPFLYKLAAHYPFKIDDNRLKDMNKAAQYLVGRQDFRAYMAEGSSVLSTTRTVKYCNVERAGDLVTIRIAADGFLYNMVRIIAGTLLDVSRGKISPEAIPLITESKDRKKAGFTAPACGLYLNRVVYKNIEFV
ncbi:MAG: tRNA pseudouridine(38-40) synthase TruA [Clostridiales bacterium]|nr:tRNA pseudouridine(38-40) synthase TruA [Clostridiales bacterium]